MPPRLVGLYALTCMERDGGIYGYSLAARIAERTSGGWRPGPGAVYPALQRLTDRGLAKVQGIGRRREYRITPQGRRFLRKFRKDRFHPGGSGPDLSLLWAEIVGARDDSTFLLERLRRSLDALEVHLDRGPDRRVRNRSLRDQVLLELRAAEGRIATRYAPPGARPARGRGTR